MAEVQTKPVYVLHGDDSLLLDTGRQAILRRLVGDADPQTCLARFDADAELATVLDELRTLPFLAPHRVVIVREAGAFVSAHRDALEKYLAAPSKTASLVLEVKSWPKNTRLAKRVDEIGQTFDCATPDRGQDTARWLADRARREGKQLDRQAQALLGQWVGGDLASLGGELDKLVTYVGERETITAEDVNAIVTATAGPGSFDLTNAITAGRPADGVRALRGMLTVRGAEFQILGMIAWHLRRALKAQQALSRGEPPRQALPRMPQRQAAAFQQMLRRRPADTLARDFRRLLQADREMKTGRDPHATLERLIVGLCS